MKKEKKKLTVEIPLPFKELLNLSWVGKLTLDRFDLTESITFDFWNGHTFLTLRDADKNRLAVTDITGQDLFALANDPVIKHINKEPVLQKIARFLEERWGAPLPFSEEELQADRLVLLTRFVGYQRDFYGALPFIKSGNGIEKTFRPIAEKLRFSKNVPQVFAKTALPKTKNVKRIIFASPELLFYRAELEKIWQLLHDLNYFCLFLTSDEINIYETLAFLHQLPGSFRFLEDYRAESGKARFFKALAKKSNWYNYASYYFAMDENSKRRERKRWKDRSVFPYRFEPSRCFSIPFPVLHKDCEMPRDCTIHGYTFTRLRNSREYRSAGKQLQNCLEDYPCFAHGNVYGIKEGGNYVAAVELEGKTIMQAHTFKNGDIESDSLIFSAYSIWKRQNDLEEINWEAV